MSRPIYEPNPERTDAALGFDKSQLQRRPAPVMAGAPEIARLTRGDNLVLANATPTFISTYNTGESTGPLFEHNTATGLIEVKLPCTILAWFEWLSTTTFTGSSMDILLANTMGGLRDQVGGTWYGIDAGDAAILNTACLLVNTITDPTEGLGITVAQFSGVSRTLDQAEIILLGWPR